MKRAVLNALRDAQAAGRAMVRAVNVATGEEQLMEPQDGGSALGLAAAEAARADRSGIVEIGGDSWFLDVHNPPLDLRIVGAVHVAQPLAQIGRLAGYRVCVIDPRSAFATQERFPDIQLSRDWPDEALAKAPLGARSALAALTHDPKLDDPALAAALKSRCFYIGALGSKKTHAARLDRLRAHGFTNDELARLHGPIGLPIGARTPAEIAISILAEMTMRLRAGGGWELPATRATADTGSSPRS